METKISFISIDNYDYGWFLGNCLPGKDFRFAGRFTHAEVLMQITEVPHVAVVSYDDTLVETGQTIAFIRENYPSVKIIVNSIVRDKEIVDELMKMPIQGLLFDALHNQAELKEAINKVYNNETYFHL